MNHKNICIIAAITTLAGMLLYAYTQGWIVIHYPRHTIQTNSNAGNSKIAQKKKVTLFFWHNGTWKKETTTLLWPDDKAMAAYYLVNQWLTTMDDEGIMDKKTTLQTALLSPTGQELFLSFDRNPLNGQHSIQEKLMCIEGLLKTIRENKVGVTHVRFLVHHQPLVDDHLEFTTAWSVTGFLLS